MRSIDIGILGLGNVGSGVLRVLQENRASIEGRLPATIRVRRVLVRDLERNRDLGGIEMAPDLLTTDPDAVLNDPDIRVVVELIGGTDKAREYVLQALKAGKHVVTANKALLAEYGDEIFACAEQAGLTVYFEGSVAGGIPVIRALREGLASDHIEAITAIVNGTSNYILDQMTREGLTFETALRQAQEQGYAEADPTLDVSGGDAAHKLALLSLISFGARIDPAAIPTEGISNIRPFDIRQADEMGYVIKSVAIADRAQSKPNEVVSPCLRVHPAFVPKDHILAGVRGANNAVAVDSRALGRSLYYGAGAGMMPTGMAVVSDIIEVCREIVTFSENSTRSGPQLRSQAAGPASFGDAKYENYLCVHVLNVTGILGQVASCLGRHDVSIKHMNQGVTGRGEPLDMVILTEREPESKVEAAVKELDASSDTLAPTQRIRFLPVD